MPLLSKHNVDLKPFNSLSVAAEAKHVWFIESLSDLQHWQRQNDGTSFVVLGGGSNIVLAGDIAEPVLLMRILGRHIERISEKEALVTAGAGENWHEFVDWTLQKGWFGLENLALIPGTVGASPIQNIGAYGVEMCQRFHSLDALNADTGELVTFTPDDCCFAYRHSVFKESSGERFIVVNVTFRLSGRPELVLDYGEVNKTLAAMNIDKPTPMDVFFAVQTLRREKLPDPLRLPNAGSFFKNPILDADAFSHFIKTNPLAPHYALPEHKFKIAAGWLIDQRGWKGRFIGPVQVNEKQALVLINHGGDGSAILHAANVITEDVYRHFGVAMEIEPRIVGGMKCNQEKLH